MPVPVPVSLENLVARYERSAVLRGLVQLIPLSIGSAIDTALLTKVQTLRADRTAIFFDELASGKENLNPDLLENNEFLHCFFATTEAALRTHRTEKIQYLARLLASSTVSGKFSDVDEYEQYLNILDDLSSREFSVLILLDQYESDHPAQENENRLQRATRFWSKFSADLVSEFSIPPQEVDAMLTRLNRTGCYETFVGSFMGYTGGKGMTTPTFHRLKNFVLSRGSDGS